MKNRVETIRSHLYAGSITSFRDEDFYLTLVDESRRVELVFIFFLFRLSLLSDDFPLLLGSEDDFSLVCFRGDDCLLASCVIEPVAILANTSISIL